MDLKIGCSGSLADEDRLEKFRMMELQEIPSVEAARKLKRKAPKGFEFTIRTSLEAWQDADKAARILEANLIIFDLSAYSAEDEERIKEALSIFSSLAKTGRVIGWIPPAGSREVMVQELSEKTDLVHCVDPLKTPSLGGRVGYFRMSGASGEDHYSGFDLKRLRDLCEVESERFQDERIYVVFDNAFKLNDAMRFEWIATNTGPIKEINRTLFEELCHEIEVEEEDEKVQLLSRESEKIVNLILHTEYEKVDIEIATDKLRGMCKKMFPDKEDLYEMIYGHRFERLWEQFREDEEDQ